MFLQRQLLSLVHKRQRNALTFEDVQVSPHITLINLLFWAYKVYVALAFLLPTLLLFSLKQKSFSCYAVLWNLHWLCYITFSNWQQSDCCIWGDSGRVWPNQIVSRQGSRRFGLYSSEVSFRKKLLVLFSVRSCPFPKS